MPLRRKLIIGFGGMLLILLAVSLLSVVVLTRYSSALDQVFRENYDSAVYCQGMKDAIDGLQADALATVWNAAPRSSDAESLRQQFEQNLQKQIGNISLPNERQLTEQIRWAWQKYWTSFQQFQSATAPQDQQRIFREQLLLQYEQVKRSAQIVADANISNMALVDVHVKRVLGSVRQALYLFAGAGTAMAVALIAAVGAAILRPLRILTQSARQIGEGTLNLRVDVRNRDEIGQLSEAFNVMAERLREFRRLDHDRLQRTQQTTQLAIDSLPDAVFVIGPKGEVEIANRTASSHFAAKPGATVHSLGLPWLEKIYADVCATQSACDPQGYGSAIQLFENGEERFLLPRAVPMLDAAGGLIGVSVILVDVTRLRHADELKSGLVSTVSHELRTPLTSIRMVFPLLTSGKLGPLTAVQKRAIEAAGEDTDRLHRTIDNLLSMSRIESGGQHFDFRPMRPADIVAQALEPLRAQFEAKGLRLEVALPEGLPEVMADPGCIGHVLSNLLTNALKFTPAGQSVCVAARQENRAAVFTVTDGGRGIPEAYRGRLFERFFRVPQSDAVSGAGLGLSIARDIVEAHGGRISYREAENGGSIFEFTLPCQPATAAT